MPFGYVPPVEFRGALDVFTDAHAEGDAADDTGITAGGGVGSPPSPGPVRAAPPALMGVLLAVEAALRHP